MSLRNTLKKWLGGGKKSKKSGVRKPREKHVNRYVYVKIGGGKLKYERCLTCYGKKRKKG